MLAKLKLYIKSKDNIISYNITTLLHGVMMSVISEEYAEYLHSGGLNPYSISLEKYNDNWCWNICTIGVIAYNVRTSKFHLEGVKITGFVGEIAILINGSDIMKKFVNVLFRIGEYTGIGIKSSLGMGAMKIIERGEKKQDER